MTYTFYFVWGLGESLFAVDLVEDELDLPDDGLRLGEVDGALDLRGGAAHLLRLLLGLLGKLGVGAW